MPDIRPFRGLRYASADPARVSALLCPPYDVISAAERTRLAHADPHNAVHLELPEADAARPDEGAYVHAARLLADWTASGVLVADEAPLIYVYEQRFWLSGAEHVARSFFCRLRLEPYGSGVRAHEATLSGPKEDRFRLLTATRTNLSPVLMLYDDGFAGDLASALLAAVTSASVPVVDADGPGGVGQRLWTADPARSAAAAQLLAIAGAGPLSIADGHHRYETALRFAATDGAPAGAEFVLALMYEAQTGGLALLPWHRLITEVADPSAVVAAAEKLFDVWPDATASSLITSVAAPGSIGLWSRGGGAVLRPKPGLEASLPGAGSDELRQLDVSILSATLPSMVGSSSEQLQAENRLSYVSDSAEAVRAVDEGQADVAFLIAPTPVESVLRVAANDEHMPAKSTYFHPKAATGLVFNEHDR